MLVMKMVVFTTASIVDPRAARVAFRLSMAYISHHTIRLSMSAVPEADACPTELCKIDMATHGMKNEDTLF